MSSSRIYRSLPEAERQGAPFVKQVDVGRTRLTAAKGEARPAGGFFGAQSAGSGTPISLAERQEIEARKLVDQAAARAEEIQREAYHAGFAEGEKAGRKLAAQKIEPALQTLAGLVEGIATQRDGLMREREAELIKVAFMIAERVVHKAIELDSEIVAAAIREALGKVARTQEVTLRLAPQDVPVIERLIKEHDVRLAAPERLKIEADDSIGRGGCRVSTPNGDIDAAINSQLRALQSVLW